MAKSTPKNTTTKFYHNGYNAAANNEPRRSPHREGTDSEAKWLEGYDAYVCGGAAPEEPRARRTSEEVAAAKSDPATMNSFNNPTREVPAALKLRTNSRRLEPVDPNKPREKLLIDKIVDLKDNIAIETDVEALELLHMELADLRWLAEMADGERPSTIWEAYKVEHNLVFERVAA